MMKHLFLLIALTTTASSAMAYSIHGSSDTQFVLKCNDGTTNTSSMPPNHNTAVAFCEDHGGVAAGYPKKIVKAAKVTRNVGSAAASNTQGYNSSRSNNYRAPVSGATKATDYNSSRSNKSL